MTRNTRRMTVALPTIALLLLLPATVAAEGEEYGPEQGDLEFTLGANGNNDREFDVGGFSGATSLGGFLTDGFEIGARHNMTFFDSDAADSTFAATTRGFVDYHFDFDRLQPFLGANVGVRYGDGGIDETGTIAPEWGLKFFALEKAFVLAMMEYQWFFENIDDADDLADDGQFVYTLGIGFNF